ncbi:unnamed protein product [Gadus morhua 'NCC']
MEMYGFCIDWLCNESFSVRLLFFFSLKLNRMRNLSFLKCTVVIINMDIALLIYKLDYLCLCECFFFSPWEIVFSEGMSVCLCVVCMCMCAHIAVCVCVRVLTLLLCITYMYVCMPCMSVSLM